MTEVSNFTNAELEWIVARTHGVPGSSNTADLAAEVLRLRARLMLSSSLHPPALAKIADERQRQIVEKGWDEDHDDTHQGNELALAALCYAVPPDYDVAKKAKIVVLLTDRDGNVTTRDPWPWPTEDRRSRHSSYRERLTIAGALIAAELDRLDRAARRGCLGMGGEAKGAPCCPRAGEYGKNQEDRNAIIRACVRMCMCHS